MCATRMTSYFNKIDNERKKKGLYYATGTAKISFFFEKKNFTLMQASNAFCLSRCQPVDLEELPKPSILKFSIPKQYHIMMVRWFDYNKRNYDLMLARDI